MTDRKSHESPGDADRGRIPAGAPPRDGVDITLISWFLSLTPAERLDALQRNVDVVIELRRGIAAP